MRLLTRLVPLVADPAVTAVGNSAVDSVRGNAPLTLALGLVVAAAAVVGYAWTVRRVGRRDPLKVAPKGARGGILFGVLIGAGLFGFVILNLALVGFYRVEGPGSVNNAIEMIGFMAIAIMSEELILRDVLFRVVEECTGTWIALVLSGLVHLGDANATLWGAIAMAIEADGMLAAARTLWVRTCSLAARGLEGSPYAVVFGLLLTLVFLWVTRRRGNLAPKRRRGVQRDSNVILSR